MICGCDEMWIWKSAVLDFGVKGLLCRMDVHMIVI